MLRSSCPLCAFSNSSDEPNTAEDEELARQQELESEEGDELSEPMGGTHSQICQPRDVSLQTEQVDGHHVARKPPVVVPVLANGDHELHGWCFL